MTEKCPFCNYNLIGNKKQNKKHLDKCLDDFVKKDTIRKKRLGIKRESNKITAVISCQ